VRRAVATALAFAALAFAGLVASAVPLRAGEDPLKPLQGALDRQDQLTQQRRFDELLREAETRAKDGTAESLYLLGRALGNTALTRFEEAQSRAEDDLAEATRLRGEFDALLERSRDAFERSREAGGLVYAPALLGLARCARYRGDLDGALASLREALAVDPDFKGAVLEMAQVYAEKKLPADAEFALYKYLEKHADDADARLLLGFLKTRRQRFGEAEKEFRAIVERDPANAGARKALAGALMYQDRHEESAVEFEGVRRQNPRDDESYRALWHLYRKLGKREQATKILEDLKRELAGTEPAIWAERILEELAKDPDAFDPPSRRTREELVHRLDSNDPEIVRQALAEMKSLAWPALPSAVYRLLGKDASKDEVRAQAVALVRAQRDPRTLPVLEILLYHEKERDPSPLVRREVVRALAVLDTPAALPILWRALLEPDQEMRESAVEGIASLTGWWFREDVSVPTPAGAWEAERAQYERWWREGRAATIHRRNAMAAMAKAFDSISRGRIRIAAYALDALDDPNPLTWRAGYDLFRSMTRHDFGATKGDVPAEERQRVAREAREWLAKNASREDG